MTEAILHILIPLITIVLISKIFKLELDFKLLVTLSIISIIPDLDSFVFWHRATFHNLFFGAFLVLISALFLKKYYGKLKIALIAAYYFLSHIVLDGFYIAWLYPFQKFHYNLLTGATRTLQEVNDPKYKYPEFVIYIEIFMTIFIYFVLIHITNNYKKETFKKD